MWAGLCHPEEVATTASGDSRSIALPRPEWSAAPAARRVTVGSLAAVVCTVATGSQLTSLGPALLVVAGVLGLPHGAVDHLVLRVGQGPQARRSLAVYALTAVAATTVAVLAPVPSVLALLVLSVAHFAEGEQGFARLRGGPLPAVTAWALASVVVTVPLVLHPAQARPLLTALDRSLPGVLADVRTLLLVATGVAVLLGVCAALRAGQLLGAAELVVVAAAVTIGPAIVVFAVWFACWHSCRHLVRVAALAGDGSGRDRAGLLAVAAAAPTALAVAGLAALALLLGGLPSAVLVVLLGLTVPHAAVVARMESRLRSA